MDAGNKQVYFVYLQVVLSYRETKDWKSLGKPFYTITYKYYKALKLETSSKEKPMPPQRSTINAVVQFLAIETRIHYNENEIQNVIPGLDYWNNLDSSAICQLVQFKALI